MKRSSVPIVAAPPVAITKGEREQLLRLVRQREKVMKSQAQERSALLLAEFEAQSAKIHHFDDDAVWQKAKESAEAAVGAAQQDIAKQCKTLGIPEEFAPGISFHWHGRGHNAVSSRRAELRQAAKARINAMEREAITRIERMSLEASTNLIAEGLTSANAKAFLDGMPQLDTLMPPIQIGEIQALIETKVAERRQERLSAPDWYN